MSSARYNAQEEWRPTPASSCRSKAQFRSRGAPSRAAVRPEKSHFYPAIMRWEISAQMAGFASRRHISGQEVSAADFSKTSGAELAKRTSRST